MRQVLFMLLFLVLSTTVYGATYDATLEQKADYFGWGSVYVVKNDLISITIAPKIGARVMQYDLGTHPSIYIHEPAKGSVPADGNVMVGGFRQLPSPQADFGWPSPPAVDLGNYTATIVKQSADSIVINLESPVETSTDAKYTKHKGIQFKRMITLYKGSTRVKVVMTMLNKGTQAMTHGIWDITQSACINAGAVDKKNFWVYFKKNPTSTLGGGKGYVQYMNEGTDASQWKPDAVGNGIMAVNYLQKVGKIGADCKAGWIAFTDQLDGYAYIKTFTYQEGKTYPDSGASVQVYTYANTDMLEVEVLGPLVTLQPGDSVSLTENWYASRTAGAVIAVNEVGLTTKKCALTQSADTVEAKGTYGIFQSGTVKMQFFKNDGVVVATVDSSAAIPTDSLVLSKKFAVPAGATYFGLTMYSPAGVAVGLLDSARVPTPVAARLTPNNSLSQASNPITIRSTPGFITISSAQAQPASVSLFALDGTILLKGTFNKGGYHTIDVSEFKNQTIICQIWQTGHFCSETVIIR